MCSLDAVVKFADAFSTSYAYMFHPSPSLDLFPAASIAHGR